VDDGVYEGGKADLVQHGVREDSGHDANEEEGEPPGGAAADVGEGFGGGDEGIDDAGDFRERLSFGYSLLHGRLLNAKWHDWKFDWQCIASG
jgi:hypothetical protein